MRQIPPAQLLITEEQQKILDRVEALVAYGQFGSATKLLSDTIQQLPETTPKAAREIFESGIRDTLFVQSVFAEVVFKYGKVFDLANIIKAEQGVHGSLDMFVIPGQLKAAESILKDWVKKAQKQICPRSEGLLLNFLAAISDRSGNFSEAIAYLESAISKWKSVSGKKGLSSTYQILGNIYYAIGNHKKSLLIYEQSLTVFLHLKDKQGQATTLNNIGLACIALRNYPKALESLNQALSIQREIGDKEGESNTLCNLAWVYEDTKQKAKAIDYLNKSLILSQEVGDKGGEASALNNLALILFSDGDFAKTLEFLNQSIFIRNTIGDKIGEASVCSNLMDFWQNRKYPNRNAGISAMYGKRCINILQEFRKNVRKIGQKDLDIFTKSIEFAYRMLADVLLSQGRLSEAEQVLGLLKQQEYFGFVRRGNDYAEILELAELTPREKRAYDEYKKHSDELVRLSQEKEALEKQGKLTSLTDEQKMQLARLTERIDSANTVFVAFLSKGLPAMFPQNAPLENVGGTLQLVKNRKFASTLNELKRTTRQKPVAIYSLVGEERLSLIINTGNVPIVRQVPVGAQKVNEAVLALRQALKNPRLDPRPPGKVLYDWLLKPIEGDLKQAGATRLMWSQDGTLRYIPVGALWDGKQYLIERFGASLFTLASLDSLSQSGIPNVKLAGMGVSTGGAGFAPLPGARRELESLVKVGLAGKGLLPGTLLLNERFSKEAFRSTMGQGFPLVHIASHFSIRPGDNEASFLLLGSNQKLSVAELQAMGAIFDGVDLLTLSACDTASEAGTSGAEVESIAVAAEQAGARAILASLWEVSDDSTRLLMENFYRARTVLKLDKSEALRAAQLSLLHGKPVSAISSNGRGAPASGLPVTTGKAFTPNGKAPYQHPYYWAPFLLIGNWK